MTFSAWNKQNDMLFKKAVDALAEMAVEQIGTFSEYDGDRFDYENEVEEFATENWKTMLDDTLINAIEQRYNVASIINANQYGGGGYEVIRELAIATAKTALNI